MGDRVLALRDAIATAMRAACPDEEQCLKDEDACFEQHPIHTGWVFEGEIRRVYADVNGAAWIAVEATRRAGWVPLDEAVSILRAEAARMDGQQLPGVADGYDLAAQRLVEWFRNGQAPTPSEAGSGQRGRDEPRHPCCEGLDPKCGHEGEDHG